ncbi:MAG: hypothetical protein Q7U76_11270 [Nitrospirota bacterium]|nr:hypothetical protein [Nitrospirota bacterium]
MSLIPSMSKVKMFAWGALGFAVTAYAVTRLAPGLAAFVGLNPGGSAIPNGSILTPPNVNELMGRAGSTPAAAQQTALTPFTVSGRNNIMDTILA